ncbi:MAG: polysaccharide deacetylase family protein [Chitinophagales bacterium]|nr:polysaccharide deacetylase family protein [Chitinophagales bacterium]
MKQLLIYTPQVTNRIRYAFDLFFREQLGIDFLLTTDLEELYQSKDAKFSYSEEAVQGILSFGQHPLLIQKGIHPQKISVTEYEQAKIFFQLKPGFCLPFDPFSAAFYLVSRYEEYAPPRLDKHGRFMPEDSLAWKNGFLHMPVVNHYILMVKKCLLQHFPSLGFEPRNFKFIPTFDVDSAYCYLNKGLIRNFGGIVKDIVKGNLPMVKDRIKVLLKYKKDPFDTYDWIQEQHDMWGGNPIYFFLVGDYAEYDKNISISIPEYQELIKTTADRASVGIHPSYASNDNPEMVRAEIGRLSKVLKRDIVKSRQHFLKLEMPKTYTNLLENDILQDYTMGYASQLGFRASICSSFNFYNIAAENRTPLKIYPFAVMDATLQYYLKLKPDEAIKAIEQLVLEVKKVDGAFVSLWHNNSFSEDHEWKGWRSVYIEMLKMINR